MPNKHIEHLRLSDGFSDNAIPSVRRHMGSAVKGNSIDYRTPLFKTGDTYPDRQTLIMDFVKAMFDDDFQKRFPWIYEFEMSNLEKVGPLSIRKPWEERISDLENYYVDINLPSESFTDADIDSVCDFFHARRNLRARSLAKTIDNMRLNTSSGTPFSDKRNRVAMDTYIYLSASLQHGVMTGLHHYHNGSMGAVIGWRGQEGGGSPDDVKQRVVYQFPFSVNIGELTLYQPLIEYVQIMDLIPAYISTDRVDCEVTDLFDSKSADDLVVCTDFTRFDQHFNRNMQEAAKRVIERMIANNAYNTGWLQEVFPVKYNIPMLTPTGVGTGPHGMGSGSGGTNFDECLAHKALQFHAAHCAGQELNPYSMAYGDDGILTFPGITAEYIEKIYQKFGQDVNQSKFHVSKDTAKVLKRIYNIHYRKDGIMRGVYSLVRMFNHLISQEYYFDPKAGSAEMVELRWLSIMENCKWHPLFEKAIEYVLKGDKYKLGLLIPGFYDKLPQLVKTANKNLRGMFSYNQELRNDPKGIYNWAVVQYLIRRE